MKVKKIKCLKCGKLLESDFTKKNYNSLVKCDCDNETSLMNYFTFSQPGSIVHAIDKSLVEAQALQDFDICKKGEWWNLGNTDKTKYTEWEGKLEPGGFVGGLIVKFKTNPMTFNECRTYLKSNIVIDKYEGERITSLFRGLN